MNQRFYYICNVFEDSVKLQRNITTDSPAATRKVSRLCHAVRKAGGDARIISLGRGRAIGTLQRYPAAVGMINNVPISYLDHWDFPVLTHLVTLISLCIMVLRLTARDSVLVFYNYHIHYVLALIVSRLLGRRCVLDIEDGYRSDDKSIRNIPNLILLKLFNSCCNGGAMLANSSLRAQTPATQTYFCYGVADVFTQKKDWLMAPLQILLGGSLLKDTGALLFIETLNLLQEKHLSSLQKLRFVVTGFGDFSEHLQKLANGSMKEFLIFRGNVTASEYSKVMLESHVGLCLKLPSSSMGDTTFPSKVVELAANGLLLISTRVSDVPLIFDDSNAILLEEATPQCLADVILYIAENPAKCSNIALQGLNRIASLLSEEKIGNELLQFWQDHSTSSRDRNV